MIRDDGEAIAFGVNISGQCNVPALPAGKRYSSAAAGPYYSILIRDDGEAIAFGVNSFGQCNVPALPAGKRYSSAAVGFAQSVLIRDDGEAIACGGSIDQCMVPALPRGTRYCNFGMSLKFVPWSIGLHDLFPWSSRSCVRLLLLITLQLQRRGGTFVPHDVLLDKVLPFLVTTVALPHTSASNVASADPQGDIATASTAPTAVKEVSTMNVH